MGKKARREQKKDIEKPDNEKLQVVKNSNGNVVKVVETSKEAKDKENAFVELYKNLEDLAENTTKLPRTITKMGEHIYTYKWPYITIGGSLYLGKLFYNV